MGHYNTKFLMGMAIFTHFALLTLCKCKWKTELQYKFSVNDCKFSPFWWCPVDHTKYNDSFCTTVHNWIKSPKNATLNYLKAKQKFSLLEANTNTHFELCFRYELLTPNVIPKGFMDGKKACEKMVSTIMCFI
jgi:hypothetical protein